MSLQSAIVAVVVVASAVYALWTLMPSSLRRVLATALLRLPLPHAIAARLRAHAASGAALRDAR